MKNAIDSLIATIAARLSTVSPVAKAVVPSAGSLAVAVVNMLLAGSFNTTSLVVLGCGVVTSLVVYLVPNKPAPAPAPAKK